ncbi:hypothetical protein FOA52_007344 [Chlamydomonas sp. UWO 241]|nr:hypothetical protein FOA52_007344 [Chlamydomonas sp. UWO 241]
MALGSLHRARMGAHGLPHTEQTSTSGRVRSSITPIGSGIGATATSRMPDCLGSTVDGRWSRRNASRRHVILSAAATDTPKRRGRPRKSDQEQTEEPVEAVPSHMVFPTPGEFQQTLFRSLTLVGLGLHTGEPVTVRVRPALLGEGRYFVRVPFGSLSLELSPRLLDEATESAKLELFQAFMQAVEIGGFKGNFARFVDGLDPETPGREGVLAALMEEIARSQWVGEDPEPPLPRSPKETALPAAIEAVPASDAPSDRGGVAAAASRGLLWPFQQALGAPGDALSVYGAQGLLSALEACGVDNARIEVDGGPELPLLDGSAYSWAAEIQDAGLTYAFRGDGEDEPERRLVLRPPGPIIVREGDAWISVVPADDIQVTVGLDHTAESEIIGKQWFSWSLFQGEHYRGAIADAREYCADPLALEAAREAGGLRGAAEASMIIANKDRWLDGVLLRHLKDEPVRHALCDLIGDLALNAMPGTGGLPVGHVVAYKPTHALAAKFVRALRLSASEADWVPVVDVLNEESAALLPDEEDEGGEGEEEEGAEEEEEDAGR